jgi:hypothetical protein
MIDVKQVVALEHGGLKSPHYEPSIHEPEEILQVIATEPARHGVFKAVGRTSAGTTIITTPDGGGSIFITDLVLSASKAATSDVTIQFTDGSNTVIVFLGDSINAPINLAVGFVGRWQGWKDARLELVTTGNVIANVAVGYVKSPQGPGFAEWDALR